MAQKKKMNRKETAVPQIKDNVTASVFEQLKSMKHSLKLEQEQLVKQEREQKLREISEREKNKSFEELLNESGLNWNDFK
ncbi:DUF3886 domain-containing protein [Bacillus lacus]|uniref:DUF3886 domain-containing protein n=1 Tax=Metabacillus lacus TaxID=1983721 RepID=A0A7X2LZ65_9BACI|nr:YqkE family protein [Metabacillus lacus]MRX74315.1 DUF3886 domain-containing protein [Metabacillus lacus]